MPPKTKIFDLSGSRPPSRSISSLAPIWEPSPFFRQSAHNLATRLFKGTRTQSRRDRKGMTTKHADYRDSFHVVASLCFSRRKEFSPLRGIDGFRGARPPLLAPSMPPSRLLTSRSEPAYRNLPRYWSPYTSASSEVF